MAFEAHQFDYLLALGFIFAFLDAYGIGANDVANSFATSVSSRSLKLWQAVCLAVMAEFLGALLLGARVTGTIKAGISHFSFCVLLICSSHQGLHGQSLCANVAYG